MEDPGPTSISLNYFPLLHFCLLLILHHFKKIDVFKIVIKILQDWVSYVFTYKNLIKKYFQFISKTWANIHIIFKNPLNILFDLR